MLYKIQQNNRIQPIEVLYTKVWHCQAKKTCTQRQQQQQQKWLKNPRIVCKFWDFV